MNLDEIRKNAKIESDMYSYVNDYMSGEIIGYIYGEVVNRSLQADHNSSTGEIIFNKFEIYKERIDREKK